MSQVSQWRCCLDEVLVKFRREIHTRASSLRLLNGKKPVTCAMGYQYIHDLVQSSGSRLPSFASLLLRLEPANSSPAWAV